MLIKSTSAEFLFLFFLGFSHHNMTDRDYIDRDLSLLGGFRKSLKFVCIIKSVLCKLNETCI